MCSGMDQGATLTSPTVERTFLAWLRTSLAFASIGIAVTQLFRLNSSISEERPVSRARISLRNVGKPLGATFLAVAIIVLFTGFHRFFESQHYLMRGRFPASRTSVLLVALITAVLIVASLVLVLAISQENSHGF